MTWSVGVEPAAVAALRPILDDVRQLAGQASARGADAAVLNARIDAQVAVFGERLEPLAGSYPLTAERLQRLRSAVGISDAPALRGFADAVAAALDVDGLVREERLDLAHSVAHGHRETSRANGWPPGSPQQVAHLRGALADSVAGIVQLRPKQIANQWPPTPATHALAQQLRDGRTQLLAMESMLDAPSARTSTAIRSALGSLAELDLRVRVGPLDAKHAEALVGDVRDAVGPVDRSLRADEFAAAARAGSAARTSQLLDQLRDAVPDVV